VGAHVPELDRGLMPWFRVDDNLAFHHKVVAAGNAAIGLWVRAGALCAQQLTDGFVPDHMITALDGRRYVERLVEVGLWTPAPGGYQFHEWTDRQPTKESVEAEREAARQRMNARRKSARSSGERSGEVRANTGRTSGDVREPLPNPTQPVVPNGTTEGRKRAPEKPLPADWQPTEAHRNYAAEHGIDLGAEAFKFRNHAIANDRRQRQWNAAFSNWLANAASWAPKASPRAERTDLPEAWR
jgi:hypothetical protein